MRSSRRYSVPQQQPLFPVLWQSGQNSFLTVFTVQRSAAVVYPISGHWIWGGGWLAQLGFHDFAGSTAVHMGGGVACSYWCKDWDRGSENTIKTESQKQSLDIVSWRWRSAYLSSGSAGLDLTEDPQIAMTTDADMELASLVMFNTNLAAAVATVVGMIFTWIRYGKPDVSITFNAALAGFVAVTAPCDCVTPVGAFVHRPDRWCSGSFGCGVL